MQVIKKLFIGEDQLTLNNILNQRADENSWLMSHVSKDPQWLLFAENDFGQYKDLFFKINLSEVKVLLGRQLFSLKEFLTLEDRISSLGIKPALINKIVNLVYFNNYETMVDNLGDLKFNQVSNSQLDFSSLLNTNLYMADVTSVYAFYKTLKKEKALAFQGYEYINDKLVVKTNSPNDSFECENLSFSFSANSIHAKEESKNENISSGKWQYWGGWIPSWNCSGIPRFCIHINKEKFDKVLSSGSLLDSSICFSVCHNSKKNPEQSYFQFYNYKQDLTLDDELNIDFIKSAFPGIYDSRTQLKSNISRNISILNSNFLGSSIDLDSRVNISIR